MQLDRRLQRNPMSGQGRSPGHLPKSPAKSRSKRLNRKRAKQRSWIRLKLDAATIHVLRVKALDHYQERGYRKTPTRAHSFPLAFARPASLPAYRSMLYRRRRLVDKEPAILAVGLSCFAAGSKPRTGTGTESGALEQDPVGTRRASRPAHLIPPSATLADWHCAIGSARRL